MSDIQTILIENGTSTIRKLAELTPKFIILEKIGSSGEVRILPRTFDDRNDAVKYLAGVDESIKTSINDQLRHINHQYFIIPGSFVEFLV